MRAVRRATWTGALPRSPSWSWYLRMTASLSIGIKASAGVCAAREAILFPPATGGVEPGSIRKGGRWVKMGTPPGHPPGMRYDPPATDPASETIERGVPVRSMPVSIPRAGVLVLIGLTVAGCGGGSPGELSNAEIEALYRARTDSARTRFTEADVRFVTGMIAHHAQALTMAGFAPTHGAGPSVRTL